MHSKTSALIITGLTLILAGCTSTTTPATPTAGEPLNLRPVTADEKVIVTEFSDFNCPACKATYPLVHEVAKMSGVHFELRHYPLPIPGHETSPAASNAYECGAAQGLADEFTQALFDNQSEAGFSDELIKGLPTKYGFDKRAGWDAAAYATCITTSAKKGIVDRDLAAANSNRLDHTPTILVDGVEVSARDLAKTVEAKLSTPTTATTQP